MADCHHCDACHLHGLLDTAIANVFSSAHRRRLATSYDESTWVLTSYLVANAVVLPLSAWLSRVFGRKNYYMACVALFSVSSLLCGLAPNLSLLIFFRVLQGNRRRRLGSGRTGDPGRHISSGEARRSLRSLQHGDRDRSGHRTALGGWNHGQFFWRWIFFINIPIGIVSLLLTSRIVSFNRLISTTGSGCRPRSSHTSAITAAAIAITKDATTECSRTVSAVGEHDSGRRSIATARSPIIDFEPAAARASSTSRLNSGGSETMRLVSK